MEDFDFQYVKQKPLIPNIQELLNGIHDSSSNAFLEQTLTHFQAVSGKTLSLGLIDNWRPFSKAFLAEAKVNNQQIPLHSLGSGYEMIFSLLLAFYLSQQGGKELICLIDEPELHLHPALQEEFVKVLLSFSKTAQIVLSTHSPLLIKQLFGNQNIGIQILCNRDGVPQTIPMAEKVLPYLSSNEINYLAFGLPTAEYHDELYGHIQERQQKFTEADMIGYLNSKGQGNVRKWNMERNGVPCGDKDVPLQVFIRNKVHHPENKVMQSASYSPEELRKSTEEMIAVIRQP
jgi:hypothetical protein